MSALIALVVLGCFAAGYRYYARYVGSRIFDDDEELLTPAHELRDDRDFVPTPKSILFGHHFTSVAGAAPIVGPCVAAYWGWLPALAWVVLGAVFMGAVHDFGALVVSVREKGRSIADVAGGLIGPRVRLMFLSFVLVLVWLVLAVFAMVIAGLFVAQPSTVLPINIEILIALVVGYLIYKRKTPAFMPSAVALLLLYLFVWIGSFVPLELSFVGGADAQRKTWIVLLFVYSAAASLLPVWLLLQPRDYINSHQLWVGLALLFAGLFVAHPQIDAPALRVTDEHTPPIFPLLFVTIACGAISGFHGLVSSGTTSKQLNRLRDARMVGYGAMLGEGTLALASTLAAVAGIGLVGTCTLPGQGVVEDLSWHVYYQDWASAGANKASAFVLGGGAFLEALGLSTPIARTLMAVLVVSFAATTLDTATRIQRFILHEMGDALDFAPLRNRYLATTIAVVPAAFLAFGEATEPGTQQTKQLGWVLWPIFGASNQMLAALTLMVLAIYFWVRRKPVLPLVIPLVLVVAVTISALFGKLSAFVAAGNYLLATLSAVLLALVLWMLLEGGLRWRRGRDPA